MTPLSTIALSLTAGLHAALYGAWKDSPHESFILRRFVRELVISGVVGIGLVAWGGYMPPLLVLLTAFSLSRISTEFYKLFVRRENQAFFRIPTQVHWMSHVVTRQWLRLLMGAGWLGAIYGLYALLRLLPDDLSPLYVGPITGLVFGSSLAAGGGYKDGSIEGFYFHKFLKSPVSAALAGLAVSLHTSNLEFIVLGTIALERIVNECWYKIMVKGYVPGKFDTTIPRFPDWIPRRKWFLAPYAATWMVILVLWVWPLWPR